MVLAEALLRVPDAATADRLIEDKLATGDWSSPTASNRTRSWSQPRPGPWASPLASSIPGETPGHDSGELAQAARPSCRAGGDAPGDAAPGLALRARTDDRGRARARRAERAVRYSFDMLGEGARTAADAERYFAAYAHAIDAIGASAGKARYRRAVRASRSSSPRCIRGSKPLARDQVMVELVPKALELARMARKHDINFTVDAEEADRLELTLDVIAAVLPDPSLRGWDGFGLAVQAYQKRAPAVIDWLDRDRGRARSPPRWCDWSRARIGTPRSSAPRSAGSPTIRCLPARR